MRKGSESFKYRLLIRFESGPDYKGSTRESLMRKEYPCCTAWKDRQLARVVELVVTLDLGSSIERCESSSLSLCTKTLMLRLGIEENTSYSRQVKRALHHLH